MDKPCPHFWKIETPDGPTSKGVCRWCGKKREFINDFRTCAQNFVHRAILFEEERREILAERKGGS